MHFAEPCILCSTSGPLCIVSLLTREGTGWYLSKEPLRKRHCPFTEQSPWCCTLQEGPFEGSYLNLCTRRRPCVGLGSCAWGVGSHTAGINAKSAWRRARFLPSDLGYFCGWIGLCCVFKFWWPGLFSERDHQGEGIIETMKEAFLITCSPSMLDVSFGFSSSSFYTDVLFSHAPLEVLRGFYDIVIPALLRCPIPLSAMTAALADKIVYFYFFVYLLTEVELNILLFALRRPEQDFRSAF